MKDASLPQLPQQALDHLPAQAVANMPAGLVPPPVNVVQVPQYSGTPQSGEWPPYENWPTLQATSADDYFVIDANGAPAAALIQGFDPAHDHIVVENLQAAGTGAWSAYGPLGGWQQELYTAGSDSFVSIMRFSLAEADVITATNDQYISGGLVQLGGIETDPSTLVANNVMITPGQFDLLT